MTSVRDCRNDRFVLFVVYNALPLMASKGRGPYSACASVDVGECEARNLSICLVVVFVT